MTDTVACAICGKRMKAINNTHLASHGITADGYRAQYPGSPLLSETAQAKLSARSVASNASRKGKPRCDADLAAIRAGILRRPSRKGIPHGPMAEATKTKLSQVHKAAFANGRAPSMLGKTWGQDVRDKISESLSGRIVGSAAALKAIETKRANGFDLAFFRGHTHTPEAKAEIGRRTAQRFGDNRTERRAPVLAHIREANLTLLNEISELILTLRCNLCSREFTYIPSVILHSNSEVIECDRCFPHPSTNKTEDEIVGVIRDISPNERIIRSDWSLIGPLELDIVLPGRGIAIEFCGLYWHSELAGKHRWYHRYKLDACRKIGIRLITVFEDEWSERRSIVEAMLRNLLGENAERLNARALRVARISPADANAFIAAHHIGGRGRAQMHFGLLDADGSIVSAMTFSESEISRRRNGWEINRFVTRGGTTVRGAASRLFKAFLREVQPEQVTSYADLRWGTGAVYERIGFQCEGLTIPNYWYFRPNEMRRYHRYGLRKTAADPAGMTEWQARSEQGWNRIYDCGHARWVWTAPAA